MRRAFVIAWLALLAVMAATWPLMPEVVGAPHKALPRDQHMALMLAVAAFCPWLTVFGGLMLARRAPGAVNLPNRDYWLAAERRDATFSDLGERLAQLGLGLLLLFAGLHAREMLRAQPDWPQLPDAVWTACGAALGLAFAPWLIALRRRFGRIAPVTTPRPVRRGSRSRDLVWREVQPIWSLLLVMPVAALLGLLGSRSGHVAGWLAPAIVTAALLGFSRLVTEVHGDRLVWRFGWLPWPRWQLDLDDVVAVEPATTRWIDGWGMRVTAEGMLYNASGTQAVRLTLRDGRRLRLGSRAPRDLLKALQGRIGG